MHFKLTPLHGTGPAGSRPQSDVAAGRGSLLVPAGLPAQPDQGPNLPAGVTIEEIEIHLDRIALEIADSPYGQVYLPLYAWLENQLERKRHHLMTMAAISERVRRLRGRKPGRS